MGVLDIILLVCLVPAVVQGLLKGLVQQVVGIAALILGVWLAGRFSPEIAAWANTYLQADIKVLGIVCFILTVIVTVLLLNLIGRLLTKVAQIATLGWVNRLLGAIFGLFKAALITGLLVLVFDSLNSMFGFVDAETLSESVLYPALHGFADKVFPFLTSLVSAHV